MPSEYMQQFLQFCQSYQYQVTDVELQKGCGHDQRKVDCNEGWSKAHKWFYHVQHDWGYVVFTTDWKVYHTTIDFSAPEALNVVIMQAQIWLETKNEEIDAQKGCGRKARKRWSLW